MAGEAQKAAEPKSDWAFKLGAGLMVAPTYEGSKNYHVEPMPVAEVSWRETVFLNPKDGLKVVLTPFKDTGLSVSGGIGYWRGRKESADKDNDDALRGLGNLSGNAVARLGIDYRYNAMSAGLVVARDLGGDRDGTTITLKGGYKIYQSDKIRVGADLSTTWADDNYMQSLFGITAIQSARSPKHYAAYDAAAGIKDVKVGLNAGYAFTPAIELFARTEYGRLLSDAADSPIVKNQGSENQFSGGLGLTYRF
ncbi:MAG: MipA/OmpV family protein [Magnetospirillum sp.]|nr:MipA/OmpV family protein [Magnetospirillum sp.]